MPVVGDMKSYTLIAVKYDTTLIPVETCSVNWACQQMLNGGNASVAPTIAALLSTKPVVSFTTAALAAVHTVFGQAFLIATDKTVVLYFGQRISGGTFVGGSTCVTLTINEGAVFLKGMSAKQDGTATATYEVYATYDGTLLPVVYALAAAPTDAVLAEKYTLGGVKVSTLIETQSLDWDTGYEILHKSHSGKPYPYLAAIGKQEPTVTYETEDLTHLSSITMIGLEVSNFTLFFQKFSSSVARVAAATEEHISVVFAKVHIVPAGLDGPWRGDAPAKFTARPRYDGTNAVAVIDTTAAIA